MITNNFITSSISDGNTFIVDKVIREQYPIHKLSGIVTSVEFIKLKNNGQNNSKVFRNHKNFL